jgi:uncharacterized protein with von Willebrand factor type A (vWA) domain
MTAAPNAVPHDGFRHGPDEVLLAFARALRAAGLPVTADRERTFLLAAATVGLEDAPAVRVAGRATLCASPQDLARFDSVYAAWFGGQRAVRRPAEPFAPTVTAAPLDDSAGGPGEADADVVRADASATEVLRHRDIADLSPAEKHRLEAMFATMRPRAPRQRTARRTPSRRGPVDGRAMLRDQLRRLGEPGRTLHHRRADRPRRIVLLIDVSGSMAPYADALLRLAHRFVQTAGRVEVFTIGTRLTHVTKALSDPDADRALATAGQAVPDWSGGTRLGEGLGAFLDRWGRRGMARRAVVVVFSDGWERQGPDLLGEQMRRLGALAHRVVWVNPHRGKEGFAPVQQGMAAALPHCDDLLAGHSMATFAALAEVVADA